MDKALNQLSVPLGQLREEVMVCSEVMLKWGVKHVAHRPDVAPGELESGLHATGPALLPPLRLSDPAPITNELNTHGVKCLICTERFC